MSKGNPVPPVPQGFHGSRTDISGKVLPSRASGADSQWDVSDPDLTYFSTDEDMAWHFANNGGNQTGRPRVYVTQPDKEQWTDGNRVGDASRTTASQDIVDTHWAPKPNQGRHYEQTLPHINWNQFGGENWKLMETSTGSVLDMDNPKAYAQHRKTVNAQKDTARMRLFQSKRKTELTGQGELGVTS